MDESRLLERVLTRLDSVVEEVNNLKVQLTVVSAVAVEKASNRRRWITFACSVGSAAVAATLTSVLSVVLK